MNYKNHYNLLIDKAKNRSILKNIYKEKHHIIPKCMGGTDDKENLIELFPEEHFVAHLLLMKIHPRSAGLKLAVKMMCQMKKKGREKINNKNYGWLKKEFSKAISLVHKNKIISKEQREKISKKTKGVSYEDKYGSLERANEEKIKRGKAISKSDYHSNGGLKGLNNPNAKEWILVSPKNEIIDLNKKNITLFSFCKEHNLNIGDLTSVANNKLKHSKLWLCFYKEKFNNSILKEKQKIRDECRKKYQYYRIKVNYKEKTTIYNSLQEVVDVIGSNKDTLTRFIKDPNYIPKLKKYKYLVKNNLKIEKII